MLYAVLMMVEAFSPSAKVCDSRPLPTAAWYDLCTMGRHDGSWDQACSQREPTLGCLSMAIDLSVEYIVRCDSYTRQIRWHMQRSPTRHGLEHGRRTISDRHSQ